jgi:hypothetical protein
VDIPVKAVERKISRYGLPGVRSLDIVLAASIGLTLICFLRVLTCDAAGVKPNFGLNFSGYTGGSVDDWLRARHFTFEKGHWFSLTDGF